MGRETAPDYERSIPMATKKDDVKEGYVRIRLPLTRDQKEDMYVGLNGVGYLIKRGQEVDVPAGVAEILQRSEEMLAEALEYEASVSKASHPGEV
jgi:hypothetical protein